MKKKIGRRRDRDSLDEEREKGNEGDEAMIVMRFFWSARDLFVKDDPFPFRRLRQSVLFGGLDFPYALFDGYSLSDM